MGADGWFLGALAVLLLAGGVLAYLGAVRRLRRRNIRWPLARTAGWMAGSVVAAVAVAGPLVAPAATDFVAHMTAHLLLGMLAPLLLVPAAPVTLLLRVLPVAHARRVSALLRSWPVRAGSSPAGAAVLNVGGLWLFYTSVLYPLSSASSVLHVLVQVHFLVAGYLLVAALIGPDPQPHRPAFRVRAAVLVLSVAGHDILAKYLYAHPPAGVPSGQGAAGALLMYYGGGALEILLMVLLCHRWYVAGASHVAGDRSGRVHRWGHRAYPGATPRMDRGGYGRRGMTGHL